jgi:hypothetical protein
MNDSDGAGSEEISAKREELDETSLAIDGLESDL